MRAIGVVLILFAIGFNLPYVWLGIHFDYPAILRQPAGVILGAFAAGGAPLILAWAAFAAAALLLVPVSILVALAVRTPSSQSVASIGVVAGVTQAIGLSRWVYAVPALAAAYEASAADAAAAAAIALNLTVLHQFAGVGIGEAIGQTLTAFWLIGVALGQGRHPRFGSAVATVGVAGGIVLLLGLVEGLATVLAFDPGLFGLAALVGYLLLTVWLIWTGLLCILRPQAEISPVRSA